MIAAASPTSAGQFAKITPPPGADDLPVVGWLFTTLLNQGPITISLLVCVVVLQILLFRSRWGLRTRAVGEHPKAAETVGIDVIRLRYRNVLIGGVFAGLGGAFLSMELSNSFQAGVTAGRGFIALAAMIVGRWTPHRRVRRGAPLLAVPDPRPDDHASSPPTGDLGRHRQGAAGPGLQRPAVHRHDRRPRRADRAEHAAGGRRPAVRARGGALSEPRDDDIAPDHGDASDRPVAATPTSETSGSFGGPIRMVDDAAARRADLQRVRDMVDVAEGRSPVPLLDDDGIAALLAATRRIAVDRRVVTAVAGRRWA